MKRVLAILLMLLCLIPGGCARKENSQEDKLVREAVEILKAWYVTYYAERTERFEDRGILPFEGYLEINDTKVFYIKDDFCLSDEDDQELAEELFGNVKCMVCFSMYSDSGTAPYYPAGGVFDTVMVYEDGSMEAVSNPFFRFVYTRYKSSLIEVISSVSDRKSEFDNTWYLMK